MDVAAPAPPDPPAADRPPLARGELRRRIVRGTVVNAVALAAIDLVVLAQGLIVTRLLGPAAIGLYGIVTTTTMTVVALKRVGVDEAFVAQDEPEQALEFQRAFTLELAISACFALVLCALAPVVAVVYGDARIAAATPARFPAAGPITRLHTPTPAAASGTVTANVTMGTMPWSTRWRAKSMRRKKIHVGAWSANASGRYAVAAMSASRRGSP